MLERVKNQLTTISGAKYVHLLVGSGTLANESMIAQLHISGEQGIVLTNGAFGERLEKTSETLELAFDVATCEWGAPMTWGGLNKRLLLALIVGYLWHTVKHLLAC